MNLYHFSQNTRATYWSSHVIWSGPVKVTSLNRPTYGLQGQRAVIAVLLHKCHFIKDGDRLSWVVTNSYGLNTVSDEAYLSYQLCFHQFTYVNMQRAGTLLQRTTFVWITLGLNS